MKTGELGPTDPITGRNITIQARNFNTRELAAAALQMSRRFQYDEQIMADFQAYSQIFDHDPLENPFDNVLVDALRSRGWTLEQFREEVTRRHNNK